MSHHKEKRNSGKIPIAQILLMKYGGIGNSVLDENHRHTGSHWQPLSHNIVLSVLLRYTDSDYPFGIFKLFILPL